MISSIFHKKDALDVFITNICNLFPEIESQLRAVPYNNEKAPELGKHLKEPFDRERYESYSRDTCIQKLTYRLDWRGAVEKEGTIYHHIINSFSV